MRLIAMVRHGEEEQGGSGVQGCRSRLRAPGGAQTEAAGRVLRRPTQGGTA